MGPSETPAQCLCPLGRDGGGDGNGVQERNARVDDSHIDNTLTGSSISSSKMDTKNRHSGFLPLSQQSTLLSRRSTPTTFYDGGDAQQCIDACRQGFLQSGLSSLSSPPSSGILSLADTCSLLSTSSSAQQTLWQLYWCDSVFCGVWVDDNGGKGQDPNVDLIINECQNIGYSSVYDPGPPPSSYYCNSILATGPSANPCRNLAAVTTETITATASLTSTMEAPGTTLITQHLSQRLTTAPAPGTTATSLVIGGNVVSAAAATGTSSSSSSSNSNNEKNAGATSGLSVGVKAAIVACIIVAVLLIAGIVFFFIRRRRNNMQGQAYQHRGGGDREGGAGPSRHRPSPAKGESGGSIGLTARLRQQGQMLFYPRHGRGGADGEIPTPLISPANSCNSVRGVSAGTGSAPSNSIIPKREGANFFLSLRLARSPSNNHASSQSQSSSRSRRIKPSFFSRRTRERSVSPPLTSLSPPPSPTQMSARGRHDRDNDHEGNRHGMAGKNGNRVSAANSGSSYYGYYGYNGHFVPYYFPSSPICAPTTNKLEPRRERTPTVRPSREVEKQKQEQQRQQQLRHGYYNFQNSQTINRSSSVPPLPPLPPLPVSIFSSQTIGGGGLDASTSAGHRGPRSSYGCYSTASSAIIPSSSLYGHAVTTNTMEPMTPLASISPLPSVSGTGAPPSAAAKAGAPMSPARPKRPHESPLEIPGLVMPDPPLPSLFYAKNVGNFSDRSFSMPGRAHSASAAGRRAVPGGTMTSPMSRLPMASRDGTSTAFEEAVLPRAPPSDRALPPTPPRVSPASQSATDLQPTKPHDGRGHRDDRSSIASLELPPLLVRGDDDDEYGERNDLYNSWSTSSRSSNYKYHHMASKPATTTASFSSTMSTSSMLSSSTADTASTATTVTSAPFALSSMLTSTSISPQPQRPFYHGSPSTDSSILTIRPTVIGLQTNEKKTRRSTDDSGASEPLFPPREILDPDEI